MVQVRDYSNSMSRKVAGILLSLLCCFLLATPASCQSAAKIVQKNAIGYLLLGEKDFPLDCVLRMVKKNGNGAVTEGWIGPLLPRSNRVRYAYRIRTTVCNSKHSAKEFLDSGLKLWSSPPTLVTSKSPYSKLGEVVYFYRQEHFGNVLFVCNNVVVSIILMHKKGFSDSLLLPVASRISQRIRMVSAGKAVPKAIRPRTIKEMDLSVKKAWAARNNAKSFRSIVSPTPASCQSDAKIVQ